MGGLGYTFEHPQEGRLRIYVFWYPRDCVGTYLETCVGSATCLSCANGGMRRWVGRYRGALSDFDAVQFPRIPDWVEAQKARQLDNYVVAAACVLRRAYPAPLARSLASMEQWRRASCSTLCHKSANLAGLFFSPEVRRYLALFVSPMRVTMSRGRRYGVGARLSPQ